MLRDKRSKCCGERFIYYSSINEKSCGNCKKKYDWHLKPDQKSVLTNMVGGQNEQKR